MLRHPSTLFEGAKVLEGTAARDFLSLVFLRQTASLGSLIQIYSRFELDLRFKVFDF